jgi:hypothetical protein
VRCEVSDARHIPCSAFPVPSFNKSLAVLVASLQQAIKRDTITTHLATTLGTAPPSTAPPPPTHLSRVPQILGRHFHPVHHDLPHESTNALNHIHLVAFHLAADHHHARIRGALEKRVDAARMHGTERERAGGAVAQKLPHEEIGAGGGVARGGEFRLSGEGVSLEPFKQTLAVRSDDVDLRARVKEAAGGGAYVVQGWLL